MFLIPKESGWAGWAGPMQMLRTRTESIWEPLRMVTGFTFSPTILSEEIPGIQAAPDILAVLDIRDRQDMIHRLQVPKIYGLDNVCYYRHSACVTSKRKSSALLLALI